MRMIIAMATFNRPIVTELALCNLRDFKGQDDRLVVYDDASTAYDAAWLARFADDVIRMPQRGGIERLRARNFRDFLTLWRDADLLYTTDNDVIHDPRFGIRLRALHEAGTAGCIDSARADLKLPVCVYNSRFHAAPENILMRSDQLGGVSIRRTAPGVSQLYDREMVTTIVNGLNAEPALESRYDYDYHLPALLHRPFLQSEESYLEHFARDAHEGGLHASNSGNGSQALADFERDRALYPSTFLQQIRPMIIDLILNAASRRTDQALA
jgi:hypothetical protein